MSQVKITISVEFDCPIPQKDRLDLVDSINSMEKGFKEDTRVKNVFSRVEIFD